MSTAPGSPRLRDEIVSTLRLSGPLVLTNVAQTGMTATDLMFMGWLGPDKLAAGALGTNLYFPLLIFGIGFLSAMAPMIASELGARPDSVEDVRRTTRQGFWVAAILSVPAMAFLWNAEGVLIAFGQEPRLAAEAAVYLRALMGSLPFFLVFVALRSFVSALQKPGAALVAVLIAFAVNALANWALVFGNLGAPALGLFGSGLATTIAVMTMAGILAAFVLIDPRIRRYRAFSEIWRPDVERLTALTRLGLPLGATLSLEGSVFYAAVFMMGLIGADSLAAHSIAIQLASLTFMVPLGVAQAASVRVGLAYGARDMHGVRQAGWTAFALGVGAMVMAAAVMVAFPKLLISAFLRVDDPANIRVVQLAVSFLAIAALFQIADGAQAVLSGMLRGLHDTRIPMLLALVGYWGVGLPAGGLLGFHYGWRGVGIWTGLALSLAVVASLMAWRWLRLTRQSV